MNTNKQPIFTDILSVLSLGIPVVHLLLFKYLFIKQAVSTYGSLDALHAEDGWRGFMISEDIEPVMLCFSIIASIACLILCYVTYKKIEVH